MTVTVVDDPASFAAMMNRLRAQQPLAAQIISYFEDLKQRLIALPGVTIGPNLSITTPWGALDQNEHSLMAEEFSELRDALFEIVGNSQGHAVRQLAAANVLTAVARGHFAGQLAKTRHVLPKEPATATGLKVDAHLADNRRKASDARSGRAAVWATFAVDAARSKRPNPTAYSATAAAPVVRDLLAEWLPVEFERRGWDYNEVKDLPSLRTIRSAIPASKIVGKIG